MLAREQIGVLLSDANWIILSCLVFSALLLLPDQVLELYRIIYSTSPLKDPAGFLYLHLPVILVGLSVWFAVGQVAAATRLRIGAPTKPFEFVAETLPLLIGALPLIACTFGLFDAVPTRLAADQEATRLAGAIWGHMAERLDDLAQRLLWGASLQAIITVALAAGEAWLAVRMRDVSDRLNKAHFGRPSGVVAALALIAAVTVAFYAFPVTLPRAVGTFGIVALFAVCILAFAINFTLLGLRYRLPFIALLCLLVVVFALDSLNDNHTIRLIDRRDPAVLQAADAASAASQFSAWLESRPDRQNYRDDGDAYPVYIVAAQGGGIYAAYQTAIFLARMQDVCPAFRHHLFAISAVSGGSVGAAVFAAALDAYDHDLIELTAEEAAQRARSAGAFNPCPAITEYRTSPRVPAAPDAPGPLERAVRRALRQDFLAPLVAGALFTDYTQRFVPWPIPSFDRARTLEYALEQAGRDMMKATAAPADVAAHNALAHSILDLWSPGGSIPALLVNATDAASGRRFVISPFRTAMAPPEEEPATLDYRFWIKDLPEPERARDIRLSTAAFMSARFPWITPAATITNGISSDGRSERIRLVDGGYVDNSGVETALDLNDAIADAIDQGGQGRGTPRLNLVVLSGGDFPVRKSFSFGDLMEPLRALLSTESSRAYVAIDRARQDFEPYSVVADYVFNGRKLSVKAETLKKARLDNRFYKLPLGWSLSDDTREIIEGQSGRYWECLPDDNFEQAQPGLAQSDCVALLIYYELNNALTGAAKSRVGTEVAIANYLAKREEEESKSGGDENRIIDCYQRSANQTVNLEQAGNIRALIQQWRDQHSSDKDLLGFVLGLAAFESTNFKAREQSLAYMSADQILKAWGQDPAFQHMPEADLEKYVRHPEAIAEKLDGGKFGNGVGNGDAWRYRPRGLAYVRGRTDYQRVADSLNLQELMNDPDLLLIPEINALSFFYFYFKPESAPALAAAVRSSDWKAALAIEQRDAQRRYSDDDADEIIRKTRTFDACITEARVMEARAGEATHGR